jgi:hypothetical protein
MEGYRLGNNLLLYPSMLWYSEGEGRERGGWNRGRGDRYLECATYRRYKDGFKRYEVGERGVVGRVVPSSHHITAWM